MIPRSSPIPSFQEKIVKTQQQTRGPDPVQKRNPSGKILETLQPYSPNPKKDPTGIKIQSRHHNRLRERGKVASILMLPNTKPTCGPSRRSTKEESCVNDPGKVYTYAMVGGVQTSYRGNTTNGFSNGHGDATDKG